MHTNHRLPIWARLGAVLSLILFVVATMLALFGVSATTTIASVSSNAPTLALSTTVLDTFDRANGGVGGNWGGLTDTKYYKIVSNRLAVQLGGPLVWKAA